MKINICVLYLIFLADVAKAQDNVIVPLDIPTDLTNAENSTETNSVKNDIIENSSVLVKENPTIDITKIPLITQNTQNYKMENNAEYIRAIDGDIKLHEDSVNEEIKNLLKRDIDKYCNETCHLLSVNSVAEEVFSPSTADMGFENVSDSNSKRKFRIKQIEADILIDEKLGDTNIDKIKNLFSTLQKEYKKTINITWNKTTFPENNFSKKRETNLKSEINLKIKNQLEKIINEFCPKECVIINFDVNTEQVNIEEGNKISNDRFWLSQDAKTALYVKGVSAKININSDMENNRKDKIINLIRDKLQSYGLLELNIKEISFPKSAEEIQKDLEEKRDDPYGINKIAQLLKVFKDNTNTKEVYKETNTRENAEKKETGLTKEQTNSTKEGLTKESNDLTRENINKNNEFSYFWLIIIIINIIFIGLIILFWLKHTNNNPVLKKALEEVNNTNNNTNKENNEEKHNDTHINVIKYKFELDDLKNDILQIFAQEPKFIRDVFVRMLEDEGIELTAKYVTIFGDILFFEMFGNLDLKARIIELSEYIHNKLPTILDVEKIELLKQLKLKITALKIKNIVDGKSDVFDFLTEYTSKQLFIMIADENPRSQVVVLSQLNSVRRNELFTLFNKEKKALLLEQLSNIEYLSKAFINAVANNLKDKIKKDKNTYGQEIKTNDILLDLIAKADNVEQGNMIADLSQISIDTYRKIKQKLITIQTLSVISPALQLEILLELEPEECAIFLKGLPIDVKNIIFKNLPKDIAFQWNENMQNSTYRLDLFKQIEESIIQRLNYHSTQGRFSIETANNILFPERKSNIEAEKMVKLGNVA